MYRATLLQIFFFLIRRRYSLIFLRARTIERDFCGTDGHRVIVQYYVIVPISYSGADWLRHSTRRQFYDYNNNFILFLYSRIRRRL